MRHDRGMPNLRAGLRTTALQLRRAMLRRAAAVGSALPSDAKDRLGLPDNVPLVEPSDEQLRRWAVAIGLDYQAHCFHFGYLSRSEWQAQREWSLSFPWDEAPLLSILTPVHDPPLAFLRECFYSLQTQSYPFWELCLVDDASQDEAVRAELAGFVARDARVKLQRLDANVGICDATNEALGQASGRYVIFVDHDDRLAPNALYEVASHVLTDPHLDGIYSDRDLLTDENYRIAPYFKPDWAPETLLSGNYMFHLTAYRRELVQALGGYRRE